MINPCRNCTDRNAECHAACPRYLEWRAERDAALKKHRTELDANGVSIDASIRIKRYQARGRNK
jgi:hypothetical protein